MQISRAFIVGIDEYDQPGWNVTGPCSNAIAITKWLVPNIVAPDRIRLFLHPYDAAVLAKALGDHVEKICVTPSGNWSDIDKFWRKELSLDKQRQRLFVYWSGHGFTEQDGTRLLVCSDYTSESLINRVFNATNFLRHLRSVDYSQFEEQIFIADACSDYTRLRFASDKVPPAKDLVRTTRQHAYFARPEGETALATEDGGRFTNDALDVLRQWTSWPDIPAFAEALNSRLKASNSSPYRISGITPTESFDDVLVGKRYPIFPGFVWRSSSESLSQGKVSALAAVELFLSIVVLGFLVRHLEVHIQICCAIVAVSGLIRTKLTGDIGQGFLNAWLTPVLLRFLAANETEAQPSVGESWLDSCEAWMKRAPWVARVFILPIEFGGALVLITLAVVFGILQTIYHIFAIVGLVMTARVLTVIKALSVDWSSSLRAIPRSYARLLLCSDALSKPELIPGLDLGASATEQAINYQSEALEARFWDAQRALESSRAPVPVSPDPRGNVYPVYLTMWLAATVFRIGAKAAVVLFGPFAIGLWYVQQRAERSSLREWLDDIVHGEWERLLRLVTLMNTVPTVFFWYKIGMNWSMASWWMGIATVIVVFGCLAAYGERLIAERMERRFIRRYGSTPGARDSISSLLGVFSVFRVGYGTASLLMAPLLYWVAFKAIRSE